MPINLRTYDRKGLFLIVAIAIGVVALQAQNLFQFPYYQDSEGTSVSNAWAFVHSGNLSAYTYAYEDPPVGSFTLGLWAVLTGGLSAFGFSINSGRVLMLILHLFTIALIYGVSKKSTKSDLVAIVATLIFAFSPLATSLQRRVLVDNMGVVWLLLALYLVLGDDRRLKHYFLSAIAFGLAVLTKGALIWFMPVFMYIVALRAHKLHRRFASGHWLALAVFLISLYPLYAQMKQELFPEGWFLGGDFPHVSLVERLSDNGPDTGRFLNAGRGLQASIEQWTAMDSATADPVIIYGGVICLIFTALLAIDHKNLRPILALLLAWGVKLVLGGTVVSDAIMLLPFLAIGIGVVIGSAARAVTSITSSPTVRFGLATITAAIFLYPFGTFYGNRVAIYTVDQVQGQVAAVNWVRQNLPQNSVIVTDNYAFVDLRDMFPNAHHYWKVDTDPAVKYNILDDDVCNIDYLITTPQVMTDINTFGLDLMRRAMETSEVLMSYPNNGWPVEIRQTSKRDCSATLSNTVGTQDS